MPGTRARCSVSSTSLGRTTILLGTVRPTRSVSITSTVFLRVLRIQSIRLPELHLPTVKSLAARTPADSFQTCRPITTTVQIPAPAISHYPPPAFRAPAAPDVRRLHRPRQYQHRAVVAWKWAAFLSRTR